VTARDGRPTHAKRRATVTWLRATSRELAGAEAALGLAAIGWALSSDTLALFGCLGALAILTLHLWQRYCLDGISYVRRLDQSRARFGELVGLSIEIVNDKILPLSYLEVDDEVPLGLEIDGGVVVTGRGRSATLVQILPLLPYQRVRRRLFIHCDRRGEHHIGPATLSSGDPIGRRVRSVQLPDEQRLLVYPKILALHAPGLASRLLVGDKRAPAEIVADPSRTVGVRPYQAGDPLRHVDWRASARSTGLLVRHFEPTVNPRIAVFLDVRVPQFLSWRPEPDELEFAVAVAASLVSALVDAGIAVGLYANGTSAGAPVAHDPSSASTALAPMLESLARLIPYGPLFVSGVLEEIGRSLPRQTSIVVLAADFAEPTLAALADLRRRHAVSALHIVTGAGNPPPRASVDTLGSIAYADDWHDHDTLDVSL